MPVDQWAVVVFAQYSRWKHLGDGLRGTRGRGDMSDLIPFLAAFALLVAATYFAAMLYRRRDFSKPCDDPQKLFRQLCLAHKLSSKQCRLLAQLATVNGLEHPAAIFVTPEAFRAESLSSSLEVDPEQVRSLAQRLF